MKLMRVGPPGQETPALLDAQGTLRDLSAVVDDITPEVLSPAGLAQLHALDPAGLPVVSGTPRPGVPWTGCGKFVAIGLNYHDHAVESNLPVPDEPVMFPKWTSCLSGPNDDIVPPADFRKLDWEVELGMVIGARARQVSEADALHHVAGYCVANDVSERWYQIERSGGQWGKGKGFDTFGPVGPWLVTADEVPDPQALNLWLSVNGERMQTGNSRHMIFSCAQLVSYCSHMMTLEPGDLIITGTPPGVGMGRTPPRFLNIGDVVELGIDGLGTQRQQVVAPTKR
ncbi:fumarylacetoacetate hydrolase family protein [Nitrogeniibacter mangrovi]|uniref:Fumarylacetoacetate hydrolase family protein n=1 Tax=Nitrogeniibacter mangrovi TaxID=2016596 RepID=A0A6C1AZ81_9RHOO|nr:fumarylacetoacetate hydrolase family protein [Nitrogeniibacter mangrovi]QID16647.1 fumarylacetoacetate hydrolase family protein [Nitrogeniibacter mangrovi]